jgi:hypothetical protein
MLTSPMGNCIEQYRIAIGIFNGRTRREGRIKHRGLSSKFCTFWAIYLLMTCMHIEVDPWLVFCLVICMDVERHPGPVLSNITICHVNIRSLNAQPRQRGRLPRFIEFKNALAGTYDVITASETWLTSDHLDSDFDLPGYSGPFRVDRSDDSGHVGVAAWVIDTLITERRFDLEQKDHETLWLAISNKESCILLAVSYRQKRGKYAPDFWSKLGASYDLAVATKVPNIVLVGDFNADQGYEKEAYDILVEFMALNNLHQHVREPTRVTATTASMLDLIITNLPRLVNNVGVGALVHENDHRTIFGTLNLKTIKRQTFTRDMWNFKSADFDKFREELDQTDWEPCFESDNIDEICNKWTELFLGISERVITKKRVKIRPEDKTWYNNYLRRLRHVKDREYGLWVKDKIPVNWDIYKAARNKYFQECDRLKLEHEEHIYANLASEINLNPKKWWSLVGQVMGSSKKSKYPAIVKDGVIYSTDKEKAQAFNDTFVASSNMTEDDYDAPMEDITPPHDKLDHIEVLEKDVEDILKGINTNKAYGPDNVSPRLIKEAGPSIIKVLTRIFNKSLQLAKFPEIWKRANVLPIYKKAEMFITTNYRPVSLLSILAKVFEKIVFKYLFNYFREHFLISVWQSGFLPGSSTITQLTEIYDQFCKAVSSGKEIRVVFLDISKAFDRVWHRGLLHKLKASGITGRLLDWLKDYLAERQQRVIINGEHSEWGRLNAGVPQGSVLGPLLFLIFINDIVHVVNNCKIRLFADDTCLFIEVDDPDSVATAMNEDLEKLNQWANKWKVDFSPPKTEELLITRKREPRVHPQIFLDTVPIKRVQTHKHLGLILATDLSWRHHLTEAIDKANRRLGIMRSLKYKIDRLSLERIYMGFIRPILEYGDIVWDCPGELSDKLEVVQLNAARIVTGATARSRSERLYKETSWEPLSHRREAHRVTLMYKIVKGKAPVYLTNLIPNLVQDRTGYGLRNRNKLDVPLARLNVYANSFVPKTTHLWNALPGEAKNLPSVNALKSYQKRKLPKKNPLYFFGGRLESAIHARLRMKNSPLRAHLHKELHVIQSSLCTCGSGAEEDAKHFFFECSNYTTQRQTLVSDLYPWDIDEVDILLYGFPDLDHLTNLKVFTAVHKYIRNSKRFY